MHNKVNVIIFTIFVITTTACSVFAQDRPQKKVVEFSHVTSYEDVLYPDVVLKHIEDMQKKPFDGILLRLKEYNHMSDIRPWSKADLAPQFETLSKINWGRLNENFLFLYATDRWDMDWFDDNHWSNITKNMKLLSKAGRIGKFVGICLDVEPYFEGVFQYPGPGDKYASRSIPEMEEIVRIRGKQFIKALQTDMPEMKLLMFLSMGIFEPVYDIVDPEERREKLYTHTDSYTHRNATYYLPWYTNVNLAYPFFLGMLEGAGPGVTFIDGNENSYYYDSPEKFYKVYHTIRHKALGIIPSELQSKYKTQVQVGSSIYMNQIMGTFKGREAIYLLPEDQPRFFEHNLYYALQTTDEYVWIYTDRPWNWWDEFLPSIGRPFPDDIERAMRLAKLKYQQGEPLGFDLTEEIAAGKERAQSKNK